MISWLISRRSWLLGGVGILTLLFLFGMSRLTLDFSFDGFFPKDDPEFEFYDAYRAQFLESQNFLITLAVGRSGESVFDPSFLRETDTLFSRISRLPYIDSAITATNTREVYRKGLSFGARPYLRYDTPQALDRSERRAKADPLFNRTFLSRDQQYLAGYFFIDTTIFNSVERDILSDRIDEIVQASEFEIIVSGIPYIRTAYIRKLARELMLFLTLAATLLVISLVWLYRSFWGVAVPMVVAFGALGWTLGFMGLTQEPITFLTNLLIPIMFVVSMSDVIHLITKYLALTDRGLPRRKAVSIALKQIGLATFLTSLTTAIGFAALLVSRIHPIRMFGLYAAIGVMFTFLVAMVVLVFALTRLQPAQLAPNGGRAHAQFWERELLRLHLFLKQNGKPVLVGALVAIGGSLFLIRNIPLDNYLIQDMGPRDPIRIGMEFFEREFYGIRPFEISVEAKAGYLVTDREVLVQIDTIERYLRAQGIFAPFVSPAAYVREANAAFHNNQARYRRIPESQEKIDELFALARATGAGDDLNRLMTPDQGQARMGSRIPDIGTSRFGRITDSLETFIYTQTDTTVFRHRITGHAYLTEQNLVYLRDSLMQGLAVAFLLVGIVMGFLFKSWKMLLVSMLPNVVPLILTGGVMGLFEITLSSSTAIVFVISFGIAVDDTIHFLTRFRLEQARGAGNETAIRNTLLSTGKAMILTSLVLVSGFIILLASDFGGTFSTGLFTALTIVFALISDLVLLPVLLRWLYGGSINAR